MPQRHIIIPYSDNMPNITLHNTWITSYIDTYSDGMIVFILVSSQRSFSDKEGSIDNNTEVNEVFKVGVSDNFIQNYTTWKKGNQHTDKINIDRTPRLQDMQS